MRKKDYRRCPGCGHHKFTIVAVTFDQVKFLGNAWDDGSFELEDSVKDYSGDTELAGNVGCEECGINIHLEAWIELDAGVIISNYTVLLLLPDYLASNYGQETYTAWVKAPDVEAAILQAQSEAFRDNPENYEPGNMFEDYFVLAVFPGHLNHLEAREGDV